MKSVVMLGLLGFFAAGIRAQTASTPAVVEMRAGQSHAIAPSDSTSAETLFQKAEVLRKNDPPQIQAAVALYLRLLTMEGHPEVRRAQMELGNLVLDGKYSSGEDTRGHAQNLEWARIITQELLGQQEYQLAVDYDAQVDGVPKDMNQWLRFCQRAAAYNIDLAQEFQARLFCIRTSRVQIRSRAMPGCGCHPISAMQTDSR